MSKHDDDAALASPKPEGRRQELVRRELEKEDADAPPPIFGTWSRFYAIVVANTLIVYLLLVLFSAVTR